MKLNSKDVFIGGVGIIIVFLIFTLRNSKVLYKLKPKTFTEALHEDYDSTIVAKPGMVESFSTEHRVTIEMFPNLKYYSKTDTLVSVFDTLGMQIGKTQSYNQLRSSEKKEIRNILNSVKQ